MTILLMLLMAFELIGRTAHEWIGAEMFVLFILHHILNRKWTGNLLHGRYTPYRILQTVSAGLVFLAMIGLMVSAVLISREVFTFLPIRSGRSLGRMLHMICSYWGFLLFSFHLGIHWNMIMGMARQLRRKPSKLRAHLSPVWRGFWLQPMACMHWFIGIFQFTCFCRRHLCFLILMSLLFFSMAIILPSWD